MAHPLPPNPYIALGVPKDASLAVIKSSYRKLALDYHPDRIKDDSDEARIAKAAQRFWEIQKAYEILCDDNSRSRYDESVKLAGLRAKPRHGRTVQVRGVSTASLEQAPKPIYNESYRDEVRHLASDSSEDDSSDGSSDDSSDDSSENDSLEDTMEGLDGPFQQASGPRIG